MSAGTDGFRAALCARLAGSSHTVTVVEPARSPTAFAWTLYVDTKGVFRAVSVPLPDGCDPYSPEAEAWCEAQVRATRRR